MRFLTAFSAVAWMVSGSAAMAFCYYPVPWFGGWGVAWQPAPYYYAASPVYAYRPVPVSWYAGYGVASYGTSAGPTDCCPSECVSSCSSSSGCTSGDCQPVRSDKALDPERDPHFRDGTGERREDRQEPEQTREPSDRWHDYERDDAFEPERDAEPADPDGLDMDSEPERPDFLDRDRGSRFGNDADNESEPFDDDSFRSDPSAFDRTDPDLDADDDLFRDANRPPVDEPLPEDTAEPASGDADSDSDVFLPAPDSTRGAWLRRGLLSREESRSRSGDGMHRIRLTGWTRSVRTARSGRLVTQPQRPAWIGIPHTDGRIRR